MNSDLILFLIIIFSCVTLVVSFIGARHIRAVKSRSMRLTPKEMQRAMEGILNGVSPDQQKLLVENVYSFLNEEKCEHPEKMLLEKIISNIINRFVEKEADQCFSLIQQGEIGILEESTHRLLVMIKGQN